MFHETFIFFLCVNNIMKKESETVEFKESLSKESEVLTCACAFANTTGGAIYIGIKDDGKIIGTSIGKNTIEMLSRAITEQINPAIYANIEEIEEGEKIILKIIISKSEYKPHFFKGIAYMRVGKINKAISPEGLEILFRNKFLEKAHFDSILCDDANLEDIDQTSVKKLTKIMGVKFNSVKNSLKNLKLISNGKIKNAAILFLGKEPPILFPLFGVKCASFKNNELVSTADFRENIFFSVDKSVDYIISQTPKRLSFEKAQRQEVPILPREALREAVINALIHRDYTYPSSVHIAIYKDKVIIKNPGMLPNNLSEKDLYKEHSSQPRNPLLAELAHKAKFIEHWGTGTLRIIKTLRKAGLDEPIFSQEKGFFQVLLPLIKPILNKRQEKILKILKNKQEISSMEIQKLLKSKVTNRTIKSDIRKLVKLGLILQKGKGKNTKYTIFF